MNRRKIGSRLAWVLGVGCLAGTAAAAKVPGADGLWRFHEINVLGTSLDLTVAAEKEADAQGARAAVLGEVERLRKILSAYDAEAELGRVNATQEPVKVSAELIEVLKGCDAWREKSKGAYSAGTSVFAAMWKEAEKRGQEPTAEELAAAVRQGGEKLWKIDETAGTVQRLTAAPINVDSMGKGFITQKAAEVARKGGGVDGVMLNIGGDVTALGSAVPGRKVKWKVGIADPRKPEANASPLTEVKVSEMAVATSGSYERGYVIAGKKYSHIIDPRSGKALEVAVGRGRQILSATVVARDNATANALATSLCVLSKEEGLALVKGTPGAGCLLVLADGTKVRSELFSTLEVAAPVSGGEQSTIAEADGEKWPAGAALKLALQITPVNGGRPERPYVAVWIEDAEGKHVRTLAMWGNDPKYERDMAEWWKFAQRDNATAAVSRATRPAGKYTLAWDGKDQKGRAVPVGTYTVWVETAYEHAGHVVRSGAIDCVGAQGSGTIAATDHFAAVDIRFTGNKE